MSRLSVTGRKSRPATRKIAMGMLHRHLTDVAKGVVLCVALVTTDVVLSAQEPGAIRLLNQADQLSRSGDVAATLQTYEDLVSRFPEDERAPVALLRLAEGRWAAGDREGATAAIAHLRDRYGRAPSAAGTWVLEGQIQSQTASSVDDLATAHTTLGRVHALFDRSEYPDSTWRRMAGVARGRLSLLRGELDLAAAEFLGVVEDEPAGPGTAEAQTALAEVLIYQREWSAAAEILQRVVDQAPADGPNGLTPHTLASRRLSLLNRTVFRPRLRRSPWTAVRRLEVPGRGLDNPVGLAVAPDGRVVVIDEGTDLALTFSADGQLVGTAVVDRGGLPWTGPGGELYVVDRRMIQQPSGETVAATFAVPDRGGFRNLENLRAGARGVFEEWFILDTGLRRVVRFDRQRQYSATLVERGRGSEIVDLALDRRGRLYALDGEQNNVIRFGLDGAVEGTVVSREWRRPEALTLDAIGNVYVLDRDEKTIDVFDPDGTLLLTYGPQLPDGTRLSGPRDLAVDDEGRLYVVDRDLDAVFILE